MRGTISLSGRLRVLQAPAKAQAALSLAPAVEDDAVRLPVLGRVAAGQPIGADIGSDATVVLDRHVFHPTPDYLLRVQGDSMIEDGILDGDLVGVLQSAEASNGQIVVARLDGEVTIKRFERNDEVIRLLPRNPAYAPIVVGPDRDLAIEGVFCGLVRRE